jgi:hypothetical protein
MKQPLKKFIIKKYIMAASAKDALKKERHTLADDVWIDEDWRKNNEDKVTSKEFNINK